MARSDCGWTCGCAGKTVKSIENTWGWSIFTDVWTLLRWWFTTKRRYIKCMHLYLTLPYLYPLTACSQHCVLPVPTAVTHEHLVITGCPWQSLFTAYLVTYVDVCRRGRDVWPNVDKSGQGEGGLFLRTSFMDDPKAGLFSFHGPWKRRLKAAAVALWLRRWNCIQWTWVQLPLVSMSLVAAGKHTAETAPVHQ